MRTKTVFNNSQLCHVWAAQKQLEGRNANNSLYFYGDSIYSYGSHYLAAKIYEVKGQKVVLINNYNYSSTTCGHLNDIRHAVKHLDNFSVSNPNNPLKSIEDSYQELFKSFIDFLGRKKPWTYFSEYFSDDIKKHNELCSLFNDSKHLISDIQKNACTKLINEHNELKQKRINELNSPEMLAKKAAQKEKRNAAKNEILRKKLETDILKFRETGTAFHSLRAIPCMLKIVDDEVKTSHGAVVPLTHAIRLYIKIFIEKNAKNNEEVGHFSLNEIRESELKIGCHIIPNSEAHEIVGPIAKAISEIKGKNLSSGDFFLHLRNFEFFPSTVEALDNFFRKN